MAVNELADVLENLSFGSGPEKENPLSRTYSGMLVMAMDLIGTDKWKDLEAEWSALEEEVTQSFSENKYDGDQRRQHFTYLHLDPRITQNLPLRGSELQERKKFRDFLSAIFYVGKGTKSRPYDHLSEAKRNPENKKRHFEKIRTIWAEDRGVVCLHVFHNSIDDEAKTREAAMIKAIRLNNLCNEISGTFCGMAKELSSEKKCQLGAVLLYRAYEIYLREGEREVRIYNVTTGTTSAPSTPKGADTGL